MQTSTTANVQDSMAALPVPWQHLPFDSFRMIILEVSRLPLLAPSPIKKASSVVVTDDVTDDGMQPPASPSDSLGSLLDSLNSLAPVTPSTSLAATSCAPAGRPQPATAAEGDREPQLELLHLAVRTLRLVCRAWRDAAATAVTRLQLPTFDFLRPERPLCVVFPELYELDVSSYHRLYDEDVPLLSGCSKLTVLKLNGQRLTSAGGRAPEHLCTHMPPLPSPPPPNTHKRGRAPGQ
jgi:hypothetical protein